jgi:hypothetical protein
MSFNGSGTFLINTAGQPVVAGTVISSTAFNALTADLATGLSTAITKDGQTTVTANIPMSTYKFTGLGVGSAATDSANLSQVQSTVTKLLTSVSGTDTITAVGAPVVAAYAAGQMFYFVATGDNTGAVTLNIDSLGAKAVTRDGSVALAAGDIKSGEVVVVVYDGTRFQVVSQLNSAGDARFANVSIASSLYVGGVSTFVGNAGFSANVSIASALSVGGVAAITGATTIGGNLTLNGGTANGVLYLNGSKVATSGTALVFDGTNLSGTGSIGTTIAGKTAQFDAAGGSIYASFADGTKTWRFGAGIISAGAISLYNATDAVTAFTVNATGNLGIGTSSPNGRLDVASGNVFITQDFELNWHSAGTKRSQIIGDSSNNLKFSNRVGGVLTNTMTLDGSGNLGLGVTPSASNACNNFQIGPNGDTISSRILANTPQIALSSNAVGNWYAPTYKVNGYATQYAQQGFDGTHAWYIAPSGTAGNTISFTQAMTLRADGRLVVGASNSDVLYACIQPQAANALLPTYSFDASKDVGMYCPATSVLGFVTGQVERARITSGGDLLVGITSSSAKISSDGGASSALWGKCSTSATSVSVIWNSATSGDNLFEQFFTDGGPTVRGTIDYNRAGGLTRYNTTSDYRAKDILGPVQNSGATIDALKVYEGQMKGATQSRPMLVAHEAQEHAPYAVTGEKDAVNEDGTPKYQQMDVSALVPLLLAEIQSLRARVAQLESK